MSTVSSVALSVRSALVPPHRACAPFVGAGALALLAGLVYHLPPLAVVGAAFTLFCLFFFRDPERVPSDLAHVLTATADGLITSVAPAVPPAELGLGPAERVRIATFLSVLDVHINRLPADGIVTAVVRRPGRFLNASLDKASEENERAAFAMTLPGGDDTVVVVQIAGLIARRIICDLAPGDAVQRGARFGLIRFGSRTDLYLPKGWTALVRPGQRAVGGETVMAVRGAGAFHVAGGADETRLADPVDHGERMEPEDLAGLIA